MYSTVLYFHWAKSLLISLIPYYYTSTTTTFSIPPHYARPPFLPLLSFCAKNVAFGFRPRLSNEQIGAVASIYAAKNGGKKLFLVGC